MPRRPLPNIPHGPRRQSANRLTPRLLGCPRVSPEWELAALAALLKPQLKGRIAHRSGQQSWTRSAERSLQRTAVTLQDRLGCDFAVHFPESGDFHFIAKVADADSDESRAWAAAVSTSLPGLWLVAGRLFVKNGQFYRRQYGYKLTLVPAPNVHLPRALRAVLAGCL